MLWEKLDFWERDTKSKCLLNQKSLLDLFAVFYFYRFTFCFTHQICWLRQCSRLSTLKYKVDTQFVFVRDQVLANINFGMYAPHCWAQKNLNLLSSQKPLVWGTEANLWHVHAFWYVTSHSSRSRNGASKIGHTSHDITCLSTRSRSSICESVLWLILHIWWAFPPVCWHNGPLICQCVAFPASRVRILLDLGGKAPVSLTRGLIVLSMSTGVSFSEPFLFLSVMLSAVLELSPQVFL